jgi:uncharacterized cupin superfamily protein
VVHTDVEPGGTGGKAFYTINCEFEVVYVLAGSIEMLFTDRRVELSTGDALTFPGGEPHTWHNASPTRAAELVWVLTPAPWSGSA